jgi:PAS domain S-box-containing protein
MSEDGERSTDQRLRAAVESSPSGLLMIDTEGRIVLVNREVERLFGYPREELLGKSVEMLVPSQVRGGHSSFRTTFLRDPKVRAMGAGRELYGLRKDGATVPVEIGLTPVVTPEGMFVLSSIVDISARKAADEVHRKLEEALRESQKLEALGTLAGGIAHDFNNILAAIIGYAELVRPTLTSDAARGDMAELMAFAERGRQLVQQILVFSRREQRELKPLSLMTPVSQAVKLLRATLPAGVEMDVNLDPTLPRVMADPTSVHQVLMNLATNAAHAMPKGGKLQIRLEPLHVHDSMARANPDLREGRYVRLTVRDTGHGIDPAVRARVFEPFFTTKGPNEGTGLGLAIVHGIMTDHAGAVRLESELGVGTKVDCLFPAIEEEAIELGAFDAGIPPGKGERILIVEDEPSLARAGERRLTGLGYQVTVETDPRRALARVQAGEQFDLMLTDFNMPHMDGMTLVTEAHAASPGLPILLTTGYVGELQEHELIQADVATLVPKPWSLREIAVAIRARLDAQ